MVVSIPKDWSTKHKLKKGDLVYLDDKNPALQINPVPKEDMGLEVKEIIIETEGKDVRMLQDAITAAYINNYNVITVKGDNLKDQAQDIRHIIHNLMALEIMEQGANKIVAKDFLNMKQTSIPSLLRKMDLITREMILDLKKIKTEQDWINIHQRDEDVNRISYLIYRAVRYSVQTGIMPKDAKLSNLELMDTMIIAMHIEHIGDGLKRMARLFADKSVPDQDRKSIFLLFEKVSKYYFDVMKSYFTSNTKEALRLAKQKKDLIRDCNNHFTEKNNSEWIVYACYHIDHIVVALNQISKIVLLEKKEG